MYEVFYNLQAEPFRLSPDYKFCFEHKGYAKARAYMTYAFKRAEGFVMITGRPGTGKTTLINDLVQSLPKDKVVTASLVCTQLRADDLLKSVAFSFGIDSKGLDKAELLQSLMILFHQWHGEGRRALLVVDEAQDLSSSAMEELRLLTNIQVGGQPLLQIFLLGQPRLRDLILSAEMEQLHQRIVAASHIEGLAPDETEPYVLHRLQVVGWHGDPAIDGAVYPLIHKFSEGVPRRINLICSRLFLLGSVEQRHAIDLDDVRVVISELQGENLAAGTAFSKDDFEVSGGIDSVPVPVSVSPVGSGGHHLQTANSDSVAGDGPAEEEVDQKKNTTHVVPASASASVSAKVSDAYIEGEPTEKLDEGGSRKDKPGKSGLTRKRAIVLGSIVALALSLIFLLKSVVPRQDWWSHLKPGQPAVTEGGQHPAVPTLIPANDLSPPAQSSGEEASLQLAPAIGISDDAPHLVPLVTDSVVPQPVSGTATVKPEESEQNFLVTFSFNSDDLMPDSLHVLDRAVMILRDQPDSVASIRGLANSPGDEMHNLALPRQRADVVERYLVEAGVERRRLFVEGHGAVTGSDDPPEQHRMVYIRLGSVGSQ